MTPSQFAGRCSRLSDSMSHTVSTRAKSSETSNDLYISSPNRYNQALSASTAVSTSSTASTQQAPYETPAVRQDSDPDLGKQAIPAFRCPEIMIQDNSLVLSDASFYSDSVSLNHCDVTFLSLSAWFDFNQYYTSLPTDSVASIE